MQTEPNATSKPQDSLTRKWLVLLGEAFQFDLKPELVEVWILATNDLDPSQLQEAFKQLLKTWRPDFGRKFPAPGDLRALVTRAETDLLQDVASSEWEGWLERVLADYSPEEGWVRHKPNRPEQFNRAIAAAGGIDLIWRADARERVWAKKRFMEAYVRETQLITQAPLLPSKLPPGLEFELPELKGKS